MRELTGNLKGSIQHSFCLQAHSSASAVLPATAGRSRFGQLSSVSRDPNTHTHAMRWNSFLLPGRHSDMHARPLLRASEKIETRLNSSSRRPAISLALEASTGDPEWQVNRHSPLAHEAGEHGTGCRVPENNSQGSRTLQARLPVVKHRRLFRVQIRSGSCRRVFQL